MAVAQYVCSLFLLPPRAERGVLSPLLFPLLQCLSLRFSHGGKPRAQGFEFAWGWFESHTSSLSQLGGLRLRWFSFLLCLPQLDPYCSPSAGSLLLARSRTVCYRSDRKRPASCPVHQVGSPRCAGALPALPLPQGVVHRWALLLGRANPPPLRIFVSTPAHPTMPLPASSISPSPLVISLPDYVLTEKPLLKSHGVEMSKPESHGPHPTWSPLWHLTQ